MSDLVYLLSSGEYGNRWAAELLTEAGRSQAESAGHELVERGLDSQAYLLSSDLPRAIQTAEIIAGLLKTEVIASSRIWRGSEVGGAVKHLGEFLVDALIRDGEVEAEPGRPIVAVVDTPLIASLKSISPDQVEPGKVEEYPFDTDVPDLRPDVANYLLSKHQDPEYFSWHKIIPGRNGS